MEELMTMSKEANTTDMPTIKKDWEMIKITKEDCHMIKFTKENVKPVYTANDKWERIIPDCRDL